MTEPCFGSVNTLKAGHLDQMVDTRSASGAKSLAAALNAQRERRSSVSAVDDINRTLAELESQIALLEGETTQPANEASQRKYPESAIAGLEAIAEQLRRLSDPLTVAEPDTVSAPATASGSVAERLAQMRTSASQPTGLKSNDDRLGSIDAQLKQLDAHFASAPQRSDLQSFVQSDALFQRLGELSRRIDALHANSAMQGQTVERLAGQLEKLARYVGRIAEELDAADFQQIETRLVTFADKLDALEKRTSDHQQAFQAQIDQRFLELTKRLDAHHAAHKTAYDKVEKFENELADNPAIRNLEKQITALSDLFARPAPETVALETRLASIEKTLVDNRDVVIEAARLAAEQAVKHFAENADHNTARTFASIQDNLTTITERLARLEKGSSAPASSVKIGRAHV